MFNKMVEDRLVFGVGIFNKGEYKTAINNLNTKEYQLWYDMLKRCYSEEYQLKNSTYLGCSVSEEFKYFQKFADWCNQVEFFGLKGYQLDKDIMYKGNKQYNSLTCTFVPRELNTLLIKCNSSRGDFPIGVHYRKQEDKYQALLRINGKRKHLGLFNTPEGAFQAYKTGKEAHIKTIAEKYKDLVDVRVYNSLINWSVSCQE